MTTGLPATDWMRKYHQALALNKSSGDLPDWDSDTVAFLPYVDSSFVNDGSSGSGGTAYSSDTTSGYGVSPWLSTNGEVSGTNYVQGTGFALASRTVPAPSGGKVIYTCSSDLTMGPTVNLSQQFRGGIIVHTVGPTTKWILGVLNFSVDYPLLTGNTDTIHWASSPAAGAIFHWQ
jgi:hypothetical protein